MLMTHVENALRLIDTLKGCFWPKAFFHNGDYRPEAGIQFLPIPRQLVVSISRNLQLCGVTTRHALPEPASPLL